MEYQGGNIPREETEKETLNVPVKESILLFNGLFLPLLFGLTLFDTGRNIRGSVTTYLPCSSQETPYKTEGVYSSVK